MTDRSKKVVTTRGGKTDGWGFVIRTNTGDAIAAGARSLEAVRDVLCAEAEACHSGVVVAMEQEIGRIIIETGSSILVIALQSDKYHLSAGGAIFAEIKYLFYLEFVEASVFTRLVLVIVLRMN
uniref:RNase H type-1 domain-containing protein n=1 Tax=Leersia perrieri TaxID=77586 RepID=A0A0D9W3F1_9ORYZ